MSAIFWPGFLLPGGLDRFVRSGATGFGVAGSSDVEANGREPRVRLPGRQAAKIGQRGRNIQQMD